MHFAISSPVNGINPIPTNSILKGIVFSGSIPNVLHPLISSNAPDIKIISCTNSALLGSNISLAAFVIISATPNRENTAIIFNTGWIPSMKDIMPIRTPTGRVSKTIPIPFLLSFSNFLPPNKRIAL